MDTLQCRVDIPCRLSTGKATLQGLQRMLVKPVQKKAPATVRVLEQMVDDARQSGSLADMRLTTACLVAFAGFLRFSELNELKN